MRFVLLGIFMMATSLEGFTKSYEKNCFSDHIHESIVINKHRKPIYSKLTNGRSDKIFNTLILSEHVTLPVAKFYDLRAAGFQKKGVPLFCYEFMSMTATPEFKPGELVHPAEKFQSFEYKGFTKELMRAASEKDFKKIQRISLEAIELLEKTPQYHCMLRHMMESIYRFAYFLPRQIESAREKNLSSPLGLSMEVIKLHILSLGTSNNIDEQSAEIQEEGIPLLCSELPRLMDDLR